jgi:hypothetical protein
MPETSKMLVEGGASVSLDLQNLVAAKRPHAASFLISSDDLCCDRWAQFFFGHDYSCFGVLINDQVHM